VRSASGTQDGVLFLTAALTGLRMGELLALPSRRDVDFEALREDGIIVTMMVDDAKGAQHMGRMTGRSPSGSG
jgi:hypothetical protein